MNVWQNFTAVDFLLFWVGFYLTVGTIGSIMFGFKTGPDYSAEDNNFFWLGVDNDTETSYNKTWIKYVEQVK